MTWTVRNANRDRKTTDAIERLEDRAAAILAAAFLEDRLTSAIKARLAADTKAQNKFFKYPGPVSTFAAKIDLAYLMNILDAGTRTGLHAIRDIRNKFAHELDDITFETPDVERLCNKLFSIRTIRWFKEDTERQIKEKSLETSTDVIKIWLGPLVDLPNTARNAYMNTIKLVLFIMKVGTNFAISDRGGEPAPLTLAVPSPLPEESALPVDRPAQAENRVRKKRIRRHRSSQP
jgi:hypothetical protein